MGSNYTTYMDANTCKVRSIMKVLILEDDAQRMTHFLRKLIGHTVDFTADALAAIDYLEKNVYDIIYLDHDLGGKQMEWDENNCGTNVAEYIRDNPLPETTKVIIHSFNVPAAQRMLRLIPGSIHIPGIWIQKGIDI